MGLPATRARPPATFSALSSVKRSAVGRQAAIVFDRGVDRGIGLDDAQLARDIAAVELGEEVVLGFGIGKAVGAEVGQRKDRDALGSQARAAGRWTARSGARPCRSSGHATSGSGRPSGDAVRPCRRSSRGTGAPASMSRFIWVSGTSANRRRRSASPKLAVIVALGVPFDQHIADIKDHGLRLGHVRPPLRRGLAPQHVEAATADQRDADPGGAVGPLVEHRRPPEDRHRHRDIFEGRDQPRLAQPVGLGDQQPADGAGRARRPGRSASRRHGARSSRGTGRRATGRSARRDARRRPPAPMTRQTADEGQLHVEGHGHGLFADPHAAGQHVHAARSRRPRRAAEALPRGTCRARAAA